MLAQFKALDLIDILLMGQKSELLATQFFAKRESRHSMNIYIS